MIPISFKLASFGSRSTAGGNKLILLALLEALTTINEAIFRAHPRLPGLYSSGIIYRREPIGQEDWCDYLQMIHMGYADCEDLSCAKAAELRVRHGIFARPHVKGPKRMPNSVMLYHIDVELPDGKFIDPSRVLGMGTRPEPPEHTYAIANLLHL